MWETVACITFAASAPCRELLIIRCTSCMGGRLRRTCRKRTVIGGGTASTCASAATNDPIPDLGSSLALPGDLFLLCTDGYWGPVSETETARLVGSGPLPEDGAVRLVSAARRRGGRSGDNIGLAVAQCLPSAAKQRGLLTSLFSLFRLPGP